MRIDFELFEYNSFLPSCATSFYEILIQSQISRYFSTPYFFSFNLTFSIVFILFLKIRWFRVLRITSISAENRSNSAFLSRCGGIKAFDLFNAKQTDERHMIDIMKFRTIDVFCGIEHIYRHHMIWHSFFYVLLRICARRA